jgi:hypothetical protein
MAVMIRDRISVHCTGTKSNVICTSRYMGQTSALAMNAIYIHLLNPTNQNHAQYTYKYNLQHSFAMNPSKIILHQNFGSSLFKYFTSL